MSPVEKIKAEYLTEEEVMGLLGYTRKTIQTLRYKGSQDIPPFRKMGKNYIYPLKEFREWSARRPLQRGIA